MDHVDRIIAQWNHERPDLDVTPMALIGRMSRLTRIWSREMQKTFSAHGLSLADFDVLATLRRAGDPYRLSAGDLIASTMVTSGTMTHRIDRLERQKLVERVNNPDDGRGVLIALTAKGFDTINMAVGDHVATQARLMAALDDDAIESINALLRPLLEALEDDGQP